MSSGRSLLQGRATARVSGGSMPFSRPRRRWVVAAVVSVLGRVALGGAVSPPAAGAAPNCQPLPPDNNPDLLAQSDTYDIKSGSTLSLQGASSNGGITKNDFYVD